MSRAGPCLLCFVAGWLTSCTEESVSPSDVAELRVELETLRDTGCDPLLPDGADGGVLEAGVLEAGVAGEAGTRLRVAVRPDRRFALRLVATNDEGFRGLPQAEVSMLGPTGETTSRTVTLVGLGASPSRVEALVTLEAQARDVTLRVRALARERLLPLRLELTPATLEVYPTIIDSLDAGTSDAGIPDAAMFDAGSGDAGFRLPPMSTIRFLARLRCAGRSDLGMAGQVITFSAVPEGTPNPTTATTDGQGQASTWIHTPTAQNFRLIVRSGPYEATWPPVTP